MYVFLRTHEVTFLRAWRCLNNQLLVSPISLKTSLVFFRSYTVIRRFVLYSLSAKCLLIHSASIKWGTLPCWIPPPPSLRCCHGAHTGADRDRRSEDGEGRGTCTHFVRSSLNSSVDRRRLVTCVRVLIIRRRLVVIVVGGG